MPEIEYRRTPEGEYVPMSPGETSHERGGGRGGRGNEASNTSGGGGGGGSGGGGGGSNPQRERDSQGRFMGEGGSSRGGGSSNHYSEQPQGGSESQKGSSMTHTNPIVVAGGAFPGYPGFGFPGVWPGFGYPGFPGAGAPQTTVVTDTGHKNGDHDALLGITVDNIRESSSVGRTNQLGQQIEQLGDRADARAAAHRDLELAKSFSDVRKETSDTENRLLTAIKDEAIRTREVLNEQRIRDLESRLANVQEARRDDRAEGLLKQILAKMP